MRSTGKIRWRVVPIAIILFFALSWGYISGQKASGYVSYINGKYIQALKYYAEAGDEAGCGLIYLELNMPDEAIKHFDQIQDHSGVGLAHCKKRDYAKAIECFERCKDDSGLGMAYMGLRDEETAKKHFTLADDWRGLGLLALSKKNYVEAERCFSAIHDFSGLGLVALKQRKLDEAERWFREGNDTGGLGLVELARRNYDGAVQAFLSTNDDSALGYPYMSMGELKKAEKCFLEANDLNGLGDVASQLQQFSKARTYFENDNNPVKVLQSYRNDYTLPDRYQQAIAYGQTAVAQGKMVPECLMEMADIYYELGQVDQAIAALDQAAKSKGYESETHLLKGRIYFYLREFEKAKAEFEQVRADDMAGEERYVQAQESLRTLAEYRNLNLQPAPSY